MGSIAYVVILAVMFIWIMKSNKKNQQQAQQLQDSLRPGMYVMLRDGLFGTIVDVDGENVVINFSVDGADEGCLTVGKIGIYNVIENNASAPQTAETPEETIAAPQAEAAPAEADSEAPAEAVIDTVAEQEPEEASASTEAEGKED